jgi:RES domain-containing protein
VYLAEHPALCFLEVLAHDVEAGALPRSYRWLKVEAGPALAVVSVRNLPRAWAGDLTWSRATGDRWLAEGRTPLLSVPSALAPEAFNYLLNPVHPRARATRVVATFAHPLDPRLARR